MRIKDLWQDSVFAHHIIDLVATSISPPFSSILTNNLIITIHASKDGSLITALSCFNKAIQLHCHYGLDAIHHAMSNSFIDSAPHNVKEAIKDTLRELVSHSQYPDQTFDLIELLQTKTITILIIEAIHMILSIKLQSDSKSGNHRSFILSKSYLGVCEVLMTQLTNDTLSADIFQVIKVCLELDGASDKAKLLENLENVFQKETSLSDFVSAGLLLDQCVNTPLEFIQIVSLMGRIMETTLKRYDLSRIVFSKILLSGAMQFGILALETYCLKV